MNVSVGVVTYNRPQLIPELLLSLDAQTEQPHEVIIVDDSDDRQCKSETEELSISDEYYEGEVRYIHRTDGCGMPSARNRVIEEALGDVICFIDDDVICSKEWLESISNIYQEMDVQVVGGPAITADKNCNPKVEIRREEDNLNKITRFGEVGLFADSWIPPRPINTDVLIGANMSFKRSVFDQIGKFDTGYQGPASSEELDIMARVKKEGYDIVYHPQALVHHVQYEHGGSRNDINHRSESHYWEARNLIRFRYRNYPDRFWEGLFRLAVYKPYAPAPIWKQIGNAVLEKDSSYLSYLKGYVDGIRKETGITE